jgi:hypothetical protein
MTQAQPKAAPKKARVDYYSVSWSGPERHPEVDKNGKPHRWAGKLVHHCYEFQPTQSGLAKAKRAAQRAAKADGVELVVLRSAEIWNDIPGFPMAMMSDPLDF